MKLYYVRLKSLAEYESYLNYDIIEKKYSFFDKEQLTLFKTQYTEDEISDLPFEINENYWEIIEVE